MRRRKVLIGKGGRYGNALRIRSPLIFDDANVCEFLEAFQEPLAALK